MMKKGRVSKVRTFFFVISFRLHQPRFNIVYFRLRSRLYQNSFITYIDVGNISETGVTLMRVEHGTWDMGHIA